VHNRLAVSCRYVSLLRPSQPPGRHRAKRKIGRSVRTSRQRLSERGVAFREAPVPGFPMHQIFVHDPAGLMIELTFIEPE